MDVTLLMEGTGRQTKPVKSFKELREEGVTLQKLDYSCGAAALATLLTSFFRDPVSEDIVIGFIFIHGQTPEEGLKKYFRRKGFSLLDLKRFAEFRGYKAAGYKEMGLEDILATLNEERVPLLVPIQPLGYNHFVVVRAIRGNRIFLADPAVGNTTMTIARFRDIWVDGIGFVVTKAPLAKSRGSMPADEELAQITAAGTPSRSTPSAPSSAPPPLMVIKRTEAVPDLDQLRSVLDRQPPADIPNYVQIVPDDRGRGLMSLFGVQNFNPSIQFGRPAGNFIDFTPPPGTSIRSQ